MRRWLLAGSLGVTVAGAAYRARALTLDGAIAAAAVGCIVFGRGGVAAAAALLAFFGSSSGLSRIGRDAKQTLELAEAKGAQRDAWQVLANGGVATFAIVLGQRGAFLGAVAAAAADTWATELGLLARQPPRLITTLRPVPRGMSGGITLEGLLASFGGALVVGVTCRLFGGRRSAPIVATVAGMVGSLFDSVLGATLQADGKLNNDAVNAFATLAGATVGLCFERQTRRSTSGEGASVSAASAGGRVCL